MSYQKLKVRTLTRDRGDNSTDKSLALRQEESHARGVVDTRPGLKVENLMHYEVMWDNAMKLILGQYPEHHFRKVWFPKFVLRESN